MRFKMTIVALVAMVWSLLAITAAEAQQITSGGSISVRDSSTGAVVPSIGDDTNDAIRVSIVAGGGSGGTSSNFGSAVPSSGTAAGFSDGTNMQLARVVDADTGAGTVYTLMNNLVRRASGGPVELIGQASMANSLPVTLASDQSALAVSQSGTWNINTVTAVTNITNAVVTKPIDGCGTTNYSVNGTVATAGGDITTTTTCVDAITVTNFSASTTTTVTVKDRAGSPIELLNSVTLRPGDSVTLPLHGQTFTSGINAIAGNATTLRYWVKGRQ